MEDTYERQISFRITKIMSTSEIIQVLGVLISLEEYEYDS
jgi:hypothetical protein